MKKFWWIGFVALAAFGCCRNEACKEEQALKYPNILDINYTPEAIRGGSGWFTDQGAWMGFTLPTADKFTNGFCGPFDLDNRHWLSRSLVRPGFIDNGKVVSPEAF